MMPARRSNWLPGIFNDFFGNEWVERQSAASPAVNIIESDKEYRVELAAPGLTKEDFKIELHDDNHLTVSVHKKNENNQQDKDGKYIRREFSYSSFRQRMILPEDVDKENIGARMENGVLEVSIPKITPQEKQPVSKQIEIR